MQTQDQQSTFLDIFIIIDNHSYMPEVFTMVVTGDPNQPPQYPVQRAQNKYPALPISGFPVPMGQSLEAAGHESPQERFLKETLSRRSFAPTIFYLEQGIMLFFRVPLTEQTLEDILCANTFGLADFINGENPMAMG